MIAQKPEFETVKTLNLLSAMRWIAKIEGYKTSENTPVLSKDWDRCWDRVVLSELEIPGNDCYINYYMMEEDEIEEYTDEEKAEAGYQFAMGLMRHFDVKAGECILLHISW